MNQDLKYIKKKYGENMSKLCRELFPSLLEKEGFLTSILTSTYEPSRSLYKDIVKNNLKDEFKDYIYSIAHEIEKKETKQAQKKVVTQTPKELLSRAGYELFECNSEEDIQSFKKYYKDREALCTFNGGRLNYCHVFFAVKKDVEKIKREDFPNPRRQDEYGTSVISIQFTRDKSHTLSIKNRYNHVVNNPDATFCNDLDNIIDGLTESFENEYGLIQTNKQNYLEIPGYVKANDGKSYKYNMEIDNVYYCHNNVIIDNFEVKRFPKEKYILLDYFILDLVNKNLFLYSDNLNDSFVDTIHNIEKIDIKKEGNNKNLIISQPNQKDISIVINENNEIVGYKNLNLQEVRDEFLCENKSLEKLELPNLQKIGDEFLYENEALKKLELPNLIEVGSGFLNENEVLVKLELPKLMAVEDYFLYENEALEKLELPSLIEVGNCFLSENEAIKKLELPNLQEVGNIFLKENKSLEKLELPNLQNAGDQFLRENKSLEKLELPNLIKVGTSFLHNNEAIKKLELLNLQKVGYCFLPENKVLEKLELPNLQEAGSCFLRQNKSLKKLELSNLQEVGDYFLCDNKVLEKLEISNLQKIRDYFLCENEALEKLEIPKLEKVGNYFLCNNIKLLNELEKKLSSYRLENTKGMETDGGKHL